MSINEINMNTSLPERVFAAGEEPTGERVNSYHKPKSIDSILGALSGDEIEVLKNSTFGRLIATAEKPSFSGSFGQYMITRMLKVSKKHEIWFLFAGKPIRVSLREFAIVTGLPSGKFPKRSKKKTNLVRQKPYWPELFGLLPTMSVENALRMLKKRKITDRDTRLKYACLALTSAVLCPSSHKPKIIKEHAELIRDIDEFYLYPWGHVAFEKLIESFKAKDVIALAQSTVALKGFVQAIQLVIVEAVPALMEVVQIDEQSSDSEAESEGEEDEVVGVDEETDKSDKIACVSSKPKLSLSTSIAREVDKACEAVVHSIIGDDLDCDLADVDLGFSDEEQDERVDLMVTMITEGQSFTKEMFTGGLTAADLERIRNERKDAKEKKDKEKSPDAAEPRAAERSETVVPGPNTFVPSMAFENLSEKIGDALKAFDVKISGIVDKVNHIAQVAAMTEDMIERAMEKKIAQMTDVVVSAVSAYLEKSVVVNAEDDVQHQGTGHRNNRSTVSRPQRNAEEIIADVVGDVRDAMKNVLSGNDCNTGEGEHQIESNRDQPEDIYTGVLGPEPSRRSTRNRTQPAQLVDYHVGAKKRKLGRDSTFQLIRDEPEVDYAAKFAALRDRITPDSVLCIGNGTSVPCKDVFAITDRSSFLPTKVMDALMTYTSDLFEKVFPRPNDSRVDFFDTKFASLLHKQHSKFSRTAPKDKRQFSWPDAIVDYFGLEDDQPPAFQRIYFPFNVDKTHWVAVCVDVGAAVVEVLDCNIAKRTDKAMKQDLTPLSQMLPYILNRNASSKEAQAFQISRAKGVPQATNLYDSGMMYVLFIHAHSVIGMDGCKSVKPEALTEEAVKLAVSFYAEYAQEA